MQCTEIKKDGSRCKAMCIRNDDKCLFHSQKKDILLIRKKRKIISPEEMCLELQRLVKKVKRTEGDLLKKSAEIRLLFEMIDRLQKGENPDLTKEEVNSFQAKIEKWKERHQQ